MSLGCREPGGLQSWGHVWVASHPTNAQVSLRNEDCHFQKKRWLTPKFFDKAIGLGASHSHMTVLGPNILLTSKQVNLEGGVTPEAMSLWACSSL